MGRQLFSALYPFHPADSACLGMYRPWITNSSLGKKYNATIVTFSPCTVLVKILCVREIAI